MIVEPAPAKLNLALHVRRKREDGYHELETLFAFVADGDELRVASAETDSFAITGPFSAVLSGEGDNLVTRARDLFRAQFGLGPVAIELIKRLPVASGIGGGSADAAATLRALAQLAGVAPDAPALVQIADALGSDVPACLLGRTARGTGRGEALEPIEGLAELPALLVNPGVAVSTARVFGAWDRVDRGALPEGDPLEAALLGRNDLEPPARAIAPVIGDVIEMLEAQPGVRLARMSGSGATCFALFDAHAARDAAAEAVHRARPEWWLLKTRLAR
jgi:4-diphosphocytidyl-2-C-methyl-D-erythritol kinase